MSDLAIALNRFGLGARPDGAPPLDPRAWLTGQLQRFDARPAAFANVPERQAVVADLADYLEQLRDAQRGVRRQGARAAMAEPAAGAAMAEDELAGLPQELRRYIRQEARTTYLTLTAARTAAALTSPSPFIERLVHFWANHFAISIDKLPVIATGGLLEFDAIRPHVLGKYRDMLLEVERHPAMLLYLDQAQSIGPGSPVMQRFGRLGRLRQAGLNENLGREILELHTLGADGGYGQADVTELARALTGWTVAGLARGRGARFIGLGGGTPGDFRFAPDLHEPGPRRILGKTYAQEGEAQARAVLTDLAAHPRTARHLATKLARHFAGDDPPAALVERLSAAYLQSDGDLPTVYRALIASPEAWAPRPAKFKSPWDWAVSALRAVGTRELPGPAVAGLMTQLAQPVWRPGSPAGWDDVAATWAGPDALVRRVEAAERIAARAGGLIDARAVAPKLFPGTLTPATRQAIERAESPGQALALLLVSPEFMRR